jgi:glutathione S-transferase
MLKLHFAPNSRAGRIVWLFEELELPYEINKMAFHPKDLKSDEHRKRHPLGRVPVVEDGDVTIFESGAIVDYVLERHKNGGLKPAVESSEFPAYLQWFHYCEGMVMPPMNTIVVQTILLPPDRRDAKVLEQAQRLLSKALAPVDEALGGKDYLIGDFSAADVMLGHSCFMANGLGCVPDELENINAYVARIEARPAFQTAINMA